MNAARFSRNSFSSVVNYNCVEMVCLSLPYSIPYTIGTNLNRKKYWKLKFLNNRHGRNLCYIVTPRTHTNTFMYYQIVSSEVTMNLIALLIRFDMTICGHKSLNFVQRHIFCEEHLSVNQFSESIVQFLFLMTRNWLRIVITVA